jgi:hypothetical protein
LKYGIKIIWFFWLVNLKKPLEFSKGFFLIKSVFLCSWIICISNWTWSIESIEI